MTLNVHKCLNPVLTYLCYGLGPDLLAFEESLPVTVREVQGQSHDARGVLHSLNDPVQFSSAWTL